MIAKISTEAKKRVGTSIAKRRIRYGSMGSHQPGA
jgi:hypothetical protein